MWDLDDVINNGNDAVPRVHSAHLILDTENTAVLWVVSGLVGPDLRCCVCNVGH